MRLHILAAGVALAAFMPSLAYAQSTCEQQQGNRVAGTVVGGGLGAILGSAVAGNGHKTDGAVVGAIGGAIVGNQVAKSHADCSHAYGYYDSHGMWHANGVDRTAAAGYFDRDGQWVEGAPNGFYDSNGRWVANSNSAGANGYYDSNGRWVPASAQGYYDDRGQWNERVAGYYDANGRWIPGPTMGRYDANGRWMAGQSSGHRDSAGMWVADAQPGYYDTDGRWRAGPATGYYDASGRWIATSAHVDARANYDQQWDAPRDLRGREAWLDQRIRRALDDGRLSHGQAMRAQRTLASIRRSDARMRGPDGQLTRRSESYLQSQLDNLSASVRAQMRS